MTLKNGLNVNVTKLDFISIMQSALDGGISYWCGGINTAGKMNGKSITEHLVNGGTLIVRDAKCGTVEELTFEKFQNGLKQFLDKVDTSVVVDKEGNCAVNTKLISKHDANAVIQFALYGFTPFGSFDFF